MKLARSLRHALGAGTLAATWSGWAMALCGRRDTGRAAAPINAPSHWVWGDEAIHRDRTTVRHTVVGTGVHWASSVFWGLVFDAVRGRRRRPDAANALCDAAAVGALAAFVDLRVAPHRLTPGFERRLSRSSLCWVYVWFAAGLAAAELARGPHRRS
jgi:hypothetical protein